MLISIQYARALAALLVVFAHLAGFSAFQAVSAFHFGGFGVDIFFVISGFIMWETSKSQRPGDFLRRRIARIVPPYWFYTTLLVMLALAAPRLAPNIQLSWSALLGSYLFIPYTDHKGVMNPILLQGWTLNFEMYFYAVFALSLFLSNLRARFVAVAGIFIGSALLGFVADKSWAILSQVTSTILMDFVLGMLVSIARRRWEMSVPTALVALVLSMVALIGSELQQPSAEFRFILFGIPSALLVSSLLAMEGWLSTRPQQILLATGDASYSLYLAHPFVLSAVHAVFNGPVRNYLGINGMALGLGYGVTAIVASVALSRLSLVFIEKPAGRFLLARLSPARQNRGDVKTIVA